MQETEGIVEYHAKFESIRTRVNLPEAYLVGLRVDTHMHIRMFQPQMMRQYLLLGCLYETAHPRQNPTTTWNATKSNSVSKGLLPF